MGAHDISTTFPGELTKDQLRKAFQQRREEDLVEFGNNGYNGSFSTIRDLHVHDKRFTSENEAQRYCLDHARKWDYAIAVRLEQPPPLSREAQEELRKLNSFVSWDKIGARTRLDREILTEIKSAKSLTIGCKTCKSSINRSYLQSWACPVCKADMRSATQQKRCEAFDEAFAKKVAKHRQEQEKIKKADWKKHKAKPSEVWYVCGLAAS